MKVAVLRPGEGAAAVFRDEVARAIGLRVAVEGENHVVQKKRQQGTAHEQQKPRAGGHDNVGAHDVGWKEGPVVGGCDVDTEGDHHHHHHEGIDHGPLRREHVREEKSGEERRGEERYGEE